MARTGMAGPEWLVCLGDLAHKAEVEDYDDDQLLYHSYRVEVISPETVPLYNDRDWRLYRRCVRQEMHARGLITPTEEPEEFW